ncbi:MarR family winged helix-turn-helix transcriptional regulator [Paenibacillus sp. JX-17]|uniref:MarR family winged helix-turn-helix transcriptional regulator n=1 Tax=Paenibacillus lacisoli TaxID=3064525 RepID=A0ABT9CHH3_9BACL|nr:MarR family winged helix-turn-helix transcriptional regulator [Paenibacillus sp. JX-17]MDO7908721.1 MarR family winged helix-turn-helix transcriptional regulator [Paenibacillus sp. JX-17]
MKIIPPYANVREMLQLLVRRFGLLQKDGAQCCGVSVVQSHIIYELNKHPNSTLNELSELLSVDTSTLSRQVQQLVEMEYVSRTPSPNDRRYVLLALTGKGNEQYTEIEKTMEDYLLDILGHVPEDKKAQVIESLQILSDAMSASPHCCTPPL